MSSSSGGPRAARTLAEELRARDDAALAALLRARPDLLNPVPADLTQLATRLSTRASVVRALERLDRFTLDVAEALAVAPDGSPAKRIRALVGADARSVGAALERLRTQALLWGRDASLHLPRTVRDVLAPAGETGPTGLGPTVAAAVTGMSPARLQEILADAGLPSTHDPVSAAIALADLFADRARMDALLAEAPEGAPAVLGRLAWGPPTGSVPDAGRPVRAAEARSPVEWLLARGLLLPSGRRSVVLPREVALHLRGGKVHRSVEPVPPSAAGRAHEPATVDRTAAGQAFAAVRTVEELLELYAMAPAPVLRTGGLGVRELRRTASALDLPEDETAFWLELAYGAGLLASDAGAADPSGEFWAPTPAYDEWLRRPTGERWLRLVRAWLPATRTPGLAGERDARGRVLAVLGPDLDRSLTPDVRRVVLGVLAELAEREPGTAADADALARRLRWELPLRGNAAPDGSAGGAAPGTPGAPGAGGAAPRAGGAGGAPATGLRDRLVAWTHAEAERLGLTGRGALSSAARALLAGLLPAAGAAPSAPAAPAAVGTPAAVGAVGADTAEQEAAQAAERAALAALEPLLPEPLDHVILQPDLTAIAPGPLQTPLAQALALSADIESKGGATVYRFTPGSVRRALDAGWTAADLHSFLAEHSRTPVPQPLSYLVDDVARRHGRLRVGAAESYLRCDDEALLGEILADRRSAQLRLRRLAPTVLASQIGPEALLTGLRTMGYAPAAESAEGDVLITRPDARRTPPRHAPSPVREGPATPSAPLLDAAVRAIRAGDRASTAVRKETLAGAVPDGSGGSGRAVTAPGGLPRTAAADTLAAMQTAVLTGERLWIGYVNADGAASQRVVAPVRVEGGYVTAYDHLRDEIRTFALHRITGVAELAEDAFGDDAIPG